ncbi:MAG: sugar phosphate isomerase/epimerase [Flavobacteriaceae bacterium]
MRNKHPFGSKIVAAILLTIGLCLPINNSAQSKKKSDCKTINLLDDDLSHWYKWIGVPHNTVKGLPQGIPTGDGMNGAPLERKEPKNVVQNIGLKKVDGSIVPLDKGKIQLQSEGAEVFYKDISLEPISNFPADIKEKTSRNPPYSWKLGVALYAFHKYTFPEQLATADSTGLKYIEGFTFGRAGKVLNDSLIMTLSPSGVGKLNALVQSRGMRMQSIYITGGNTIADWERDFKIAKKMNVQYVTAEPPVNMWNSVDSLAGKYNLKVAIHNHYKGTSPYWDPDSVLVALKDHPNFGACPDLGHYPKSGINPVAALKKLEGHIIAIHLKDIAAYNDPELKDVPVGTGVIDFPKVFDELKRQNFNGHIIIERDAEDWPNNLSAINKGVRYINESLGLPEISSLEPKNKVRAAPTIQEKSIEDNADTGPIDDFFEGKWDVVLKATPNGDVPLTMSFVLNERKWIGSFIDPQTQQEMQMKSVGYKAEGLLLELSLGGYEVIISLKKEDDHRANGKLMGMFDVEAIRAKK